MPYGGAPQGPLSTTLRCLCLPSCRTPSSTTCALVTTAPQGGTLCTCACRVGAPAGCLPSAVSSVCRSGKKPEAESWGQKTRCFLPQSQMGSASLSCPLMSRRAAMPAGQTASARRALPFFWSHAPFCPALHLFPQWSSAPSSWATTSTCPTMCRRQRQHQRGRCVLGGLAGVGWGRLCVRWGGWGWVGGGCLCWREGANQVLAHALPSELPA